MKILNYVVVLIITTLFIGCNHSIPESKIPVSDDLPLFTLLSADVTHINFSNTLTEGLNTNVLMYEYFYNGGGVAVGDLNNDGLDDIYFTGNMKPNKLYINKGNMKFEDVSASAGVEGRPGPWKTGVTMVDINSDGKLDLYVCRSGSVKPEKKRNELYINNGNDANGIPRFTEQAGKYGLNNPANSTQAIFFDYDKDGDLDMFLLNHNPKLLPIFDEATTKFYLGKSDLFSGVRFYNNNKGFYTDVTKQVGIQGSALTYGLGVGVSDINGDGWLDIYVSNDYSIPDYLYINTGKSGKMGFTDRLEKNIGHTSHFSMGNNVSDVNNDGRPDIYTLDMIPEDNHRQKMLLAPDNYEAFDLNLKVGFHHQYMRNMLQINNGDNNLSYDGIPSFSEIGQFSGLSNTDWSWSPLFADYDNDGWKDLFVTNGYTKDYTNMDFLKYMGDFLQNNKGNVRRNNLMDLVKKMPSSGVISYLFKNNGGLKRKTSFSDVSKLWGITKSSNSNGAAYSDLDNDGDLDLIVNNINQVAFVYRNESNLKSKNHYLKVKLKGNGANTQGIGVNVTLFSKGRMQYLEQMPTRGYQSSVSLTLHFGLGENEKNNPIDSVQIVWPSGLKQVSFNVKADQTITFLESQASDKYRVKKLKQTEFTEFVSPITYNHNICNLNDFKRQPLLVNPLSFFGPCLTKGDVNGDGFEDVYVGGGNGKEGAIFLGKTGNIFQEMHLSSFAKDKQCNDADAVFFDANGDEFEDLYVVSGGYGKYMPDDPLLNDRLYINNGKGNFIKSPYALPGMLTSKSCVKVIDINGDNKPDLFIGGRVVPGRYPDTPQSYLLINDGTGHFRDKTKELCPAIQHIGMVTDAAWVDLNNDNQSELIIVGEWMPILVFAKINGKFVDKTSGYFSTLYKGWWNKLLVGDFNKDGKPDLIVGNHGLNTLCKASDKEPAEIIYKDFDDNGSIDPILSFYNNGKKFPYVFRDEMLDQISMMRSRFPDYKSYADQTLETIFTSDELKGARHLEANCLRTIYFQGGKDGRFSEIPLPEEVQYSPIFAMSAIDYNDDGYLDLILAGNINHARLRFGKSDANYGLLLKNDKNGNFIALPQYESGFRLTGDVRSILQLNKVLLFGINQQPVRAYKKTKL